MKYQVRLSGVWLDCERAKELPFNMLAFWIDGGYIRGVTSQWQHRTAEVARYMATTAQAGANICRRSHNAQFQVLRKTAITYPFSFPLCDLLICEFDTQEVVDRTVKVCSENGTESIIVSHPQPLSAEFRAMSERILQKVISRQPKAYQPYPDKVPQYLIAYVVETLECGHKQEFGFLDAAEPLTAKRRVCKECSSLPCKKPVQSVRIAAEKKEIA